MTDTGTDPALADAPENAPVTSGAVSTPGSAASSAASDPDLPSIDDLEEAMRDVVDPELGINVVDLGLLYGIDVHAEDAGPVATLDLTLTSAACPLTDVIEEQARAALVMAGLVDDVRINWVWMPPWDMAKIPPDGRDQLRALGFNV